MDATGRVWCGGFVRDGPHPPAQASLAGGLRRRSAPLVALLVGLITTPSGDAPSHLFQTWLYSHAGFELWNNYWYAGRYEFVTYSVLYYPLAAQVGQAWQCWCRRPACSCGSFARAAQVEWGSAGGARPGDGLRRDGAVRDPHGRRPLPVPGRQPPAGRCRSSCCSRRWRLAFAASVFATLAFSPLAFALLVALLAGVRAGPAAAAVDASHAPLRVRRDPGRVPGRRVHAARLPDPAPGTRTT